MRKLKIVRVSPGAGPKVEGFDTATVEIADGRTQMIILRSDDVDMATVERVRDSLRKAAAMTRAPDAPASQILVFAVGQSDDVELYEVE